MRSILLAGLSVLLLSVPLLAGEEPQAPSSEATPPRPPMPSGPVVLFRFGGGLVEQLETDLEDGGSFRVDRYYVEPGVDIFLSRELQVALGVGFGEERYRFDGDEGLAGSDPWGEAQSYSVGARVRYVIDRDWTAFVAPSLRWVVERGANLGDGFKFGLFGGAGYEVSETFTIGPGLGFLTEIEDRPMLFPFLLIEWQIDPDWSLSTGRGLAATRGPGLVLSYRLADQLRIGLGSRWERYRFRLDDEGPAPDGVGEESSLPVYLGLTWKPTARTSGSLIAGVNFAGRLALHDERGDRIQREDYDPAPFFGLVFTVGF
jgi:hypothetical protein